MILLRLTAQQRFRLRQQLRTTHDLPVYKHTLALLQIDGGLSTTQVATMLGVSPRSVELWLNQYMRNPVPSVLIPKHSPGRPSLWTEDLQAVLRAALHQTPEEWGYQAANWTVPLLRQHLTHWYVPALADDTIRRQLHDFGYVWKRPRYVLAPDPLLALKKRRIRRQIHDLPPRSVVLFEDETDLLLFPPLRACWSLRGQDAEVRLCGANARRVLFGTVNIRTGNRLLYVRQRQRGEDFQAFLQVLHQHYRGWHIVLLLDEDSSHTANKSRRLAADLQIRLLWLPHRSPHLNAMDHLWRHAKERICANRQYLSIEDQVQRFIHYLQTLSSQETLCKAGISSQHYWLR
jgi:transposase